VTKEEAVKAFWDHYTPLIEGVDDATLRAIAELGREISWREVAEHYRSLGALGFSWDPSNDKPIGHALVLHACKKLGLKTDY
jgi:hypothetical protein